MSSPAVSQSVEEKQGKGVPSVLLAHPMGNQNVRNALKSLVEQEMLAEFWTTIAWDRHVWWRRMLPSSLRVQLERRAFDAPKGRLKSDPWRECVRLGGRSSALGRFLSSGERPFSVPGVYRQFDAKVGQRLRRIDVNAVYAYEGCALETFREARKRGTTTVYELPSSYWYWERALMAEQAERNPEFSNLLPKLAETSAHMQRKDEELRLADYIFVLSRHVQNTLGMMVSQEKIRLISYGAPPVRAKKADCLDAGKPLRVLFVGSLIQRKGISYVLDAIELLGSQVELTIVGSRYAPNRRVDEACKRWRWFETLPHFRVLEAMQDADVFVLPSLAEGCSLVVPEALACGLPVIVTPHTGTLEFVDDGREGFIVPICNAEAIADRLNQLNRDRELLADMSRRAHATAARKSWDNYRAEWAQAMRAISCN